jgi:hypothetical protein
MVVSTQQTHPPENNSFEISAYTQIVRKLCGEYPLQVKRLSPRTLTTIISPALK